MPGELSPGSYELDLFTVDGLDGASVLGDEGCFACAMRADNVDFQAICYDNEGSV